MQNAGIRIAHSLAVFEMRDCSPTVNDRHAPASGASCCRAETGSTPMILRTTVSPDGDGQTTATCEAGIDVGGDRRSAAECRPSVLQATESDLRPRRLRRVRRRPLSAILCERGRPAWSAARTLLSTAADRILRRLGCRARYRVACGGFLCAPRISRAGPARCAAG